MRRAAAACFLAPRLAIRPSKPPRHRYLLSPPGFYAESDEEDEQESRAKRARKIPHVLLPEEDLAALDDEVERVIKHR